MTPRVHMYQIVEWFRSNVIPKYQKGQAEHGGKLWEKHGALRNLEDEILDQAVYFATAKQQLAQMAKDGKTAADAYAFLFGDE